jgi:uncharacterized protein YqjF (DUF2071 family)
MNPTLDHLQPERSFLTAHWRDLVMVNYRVPPEMLRPWIPRGTSLDLWQGEAFVSLVAFKFLDTRVLGCPVPGHRHFEEVNLRFYVVRETAQGYRRGVVFIREIVPKRIIAWVANTFYNEHYVAVPMRHSGQATPAAPTSLSYGWQMKKNWHEISVTTVGKVALPAEESQASFIAEHYWGYACQKDGSTMEYQVEHPPWQVDSLSSCEVKIDVKSVYGEPWVEFLTQEPASAFLALGSKVRVRRGRRLFDTYPSR